MMTDSGGRDPGTEMGRQTLLGGEVIGHDLVRGPLGPLLGDPGPQGPLLVGDPGPQKGAGNGRQGLATCPHTGTGRPYHLVIGHLVGLTGPVVCREGRDLFHLGAEGPYLGIRIRLGHFPLATEWQCVVGLDRALGHLSLCCITASRERPHWRRDPGVGLCHKSPLLSGKVQGRGGGVGEAERSKIEPACTVGEAGGCHHQEVH